MSTVSFCCVLATGLLFAAWRHPPPEPQYVKPAAVHAVPAQGYKVVLIAGDGHLAVFDNAVEGVATRLHDQDGVASADIQRLSAVPATITQSGARPATLTHVLSAVSAMKPRPGQACFVFATSHGAPDRGLSLSMSDEFLDPSDLDRALARGCGDAPTAVVISGCFSGTFAKFPMTRTHRIVLTAARPDRTSFGCSADETYTVFDQCFLNALDAGGTWRMVYISVRHCVSTEERRRHVTPSEPQAWFGPAVADMAPPSHTSPP